MRVHRHARKGCTQTTYIIYTYNIYTYIYNLYSLCLNRNINFLNLRNCSKPINKQLKTIGFVNCFSDCECDDKVKMKA